MAESYSPPGSSTAYTVPELTDPADAPQAFRDFADSVQSVADMLTVTDVAADMTLAAGDEGTMLSVDTATAAADVTITVPDNATVALPVGFTVAVANVGGGGFKVKLTKGQGVVIQDQGFLQVEDYRITTLVKISENFWLVQAGSATYTPPTGPKWATVTGGVESTYTEGDFTYRQHEIHSGESITVVDEGYVETFLILGGGGGGGGTDADGSSYPGGSGGAGGAFFKRNFVLSAQTITATIGAGGAAGGNRASGGRGGNTVCTVNGVSITCGGGGGGRQMYGGDNTAGNPGANGGGAGGTGGGASSPGVNAGTGTTTTPNLFLNSKQYGTSKVNGANTGNGQGSAKSAGQAGVVLIRYPVFPE